MTRQPIRRTARPATRPAAHLVGGDAHRPAVMPDPGRASPAASLSLPLTGCQGRTSSRRAAAAPLRSGRSTLTSARAAANPRHLSRRRTTPRPSPDPPLQDRPSLPPAGKARPPPGHPAGGYDPWIENLVASAPPLTASQRDKLALLLRARPLGLPPGTKQGGIASARRRAA